MKDRLAIQVIKGRLQSVYMCDIFPPCNRILILYQIWHLVTLRSPCMLHVPICWERVTHKMGHVLFCLTGSSTDNQSRE